jgi:hypothetical protein
MKYEQANETKNGFLGSALGMFSHSPNVKMAAKSGTPAMEALKPTAPVSVPSVARAIGLTADVTAQTVTDSSALDNNPEARAKKPGEEGAPGLKGANLTPLTVQAGGPAFTLTVNGSEFSPNSKVLFNGVAVPTTFVSPTQMTAAIPANLVATSRIVAVSVTTGGVASSTAEFTITPAPVGSGTSGKKKKK